MKHLIYILSTLVLFLVLQIVLDYRNTENFNLLNSFVYSLNYSLSLILVNYLIQFYCLSLSKYSIVSFFKKEYLNELVKLEHADKVFNRHENYLSNISQALNVQKIIQNSDKEISFKTKSTWKTFGELVKITLISDSELLLDSKLVFGLFDWGKNAKNLVKIKNIITQ
ncbi:MAG: hypothetical protein ABI851_00305 [Saprospiraceae bacterium]